MTEKIEDIAAAAPYDTGDDSLYSRLGGLYGISAAVDNLVDRLYVNQFGNANPKVAEFHEQQGHAGFKFLVTAWSIQETGGPAIYPMAKSASSKSRSRLRPRRSSSFWTNLWRARDARNRPPSFSFSRS